jgi:hypothetical protein
MSSRRPLTLMGILLILLLGYLYRANFYPLVSGSYPTPSAEPAPLAGKNTVGRPTSTTSIPGSRDLPHYVSNCRRTPNHPRVPTVPNVETRICRLLSRAHTT